MAEDNGDFSRRKVLKSAAAATGVAGLGSTATAASGDSLSDVEREELLREYRDPVAARRAVNSQTELLRELEADGVLPATRVDNLDTLTEPTDGVGESVGVESFGEEHVPVIKTFRQVEEGYLSVSVYPEQDTAHAVLNPTRDGEPVGESGLVTYGSTPEITGCPTGYCPECSCEVYCCQKGVTGCLQYCKDCGCSCECCSSWC